MILLTSADKIREFRDLSLQIKGNKINPVIMDAQIKDVRPLLGDDLFYKILAAPEDYTALLDPATFQLDDASTSYSFGLERVICEFAYARYVFNSSDISTPNGLVVKNNENATNTSIERAKELYTEQRKIAVTYWLSVERYLIHNRDLYPTFRKDLVKTESNKTTYIKRRPWL